MLLVGALFQALNSLWEKFLHGKPITVESYIFKIARVTGKSEYDVFCESAENWHMFWETGLPRWARRPTDWTGPYFEPSYSREDEVRMLKEEAEALKDDLNAIERRMGELKAGKKPDE